MTRYPKSGKGKKWTQLELKSIPTAWAGDVVSDGDGLSGEIRTGTDSKTSIRFRYAFKWVGKVCWYQCGTWPVQTLESIRSARDEARQLLKQGVNPVEKRRAVKIELQAEVEAVIANEAIKKQNSLTFREMFDAWINDGVSRQDGNASLVRSFSKDVLPTLGQSEVRLITEHSLRKVLRAVVARGCNRTAVVLFQNLVQLFNWAEKRRPWRQLLIDGKPTDLLEIRKIVSNDYDLDDYRERTLSPVELLELQDIFVDSAAAYVQAPAGQKYSVSRPFKAENVLALWISLATLCRIGELLMARWAEVDLENRYWFIPVQNVKGATGKKKAHHIWLSDFALAKFRELKELTGETAYLFPSRNHDGHVCVKSVSKQVGDRQTRFKNRSKTLKNRKNDDSLVLINGDKGDWTPHDLRRTGSTMMQALKIWPDIIDRCQNHVLQGSKVRRSYLHHDYRTEKREAWDALGKELERIFSGDLQLPALRPALPADRILVSNRTQLNIASTLSRVEEIAEV